MSPPRTSPTFVPPIRNCPTWAGWPRAWNLAFCPPSNPELRREVGFANPARALGQEPCRELLTTALLGAGILPASAGEEGALQADCSAAVPES